MPFVLRNSLGTYYTYFSRHFGDCLLFQQQRPRAHGSWDCADGSAYNCPPHCQCTSVESTPVTENEEKESISDTRTKASESTEILIEFVTRILSRRFSPLRLGLLFSSGVPYRLNENPYSFLQFSCLNSPSAQQKMDFQCSYPYEKHEESVHFLRRIITFS